jgi:hypothetical protein
MMSPVLDCAPHRATRASLATCLAARAPLVALCVVMGAAGCIELAACSASSATPPVLGDCKGEPDASSASCATSTGGGGASSGGGSDSGSGTPDGGEEIDGGSCGTAGSLLNATNSMCQPCLDTSCCLAASACTGQCSSLVTCPAGAIASCETTYPQGVAAYNDLGACITQFCMMQCPPLPVPTAGDI